MKLLYQRNRKDYRNIYNLTTIHIKRNTIELLIAFVAEVTIVDDFDKIFN